MFGDLRPGAKPAGPSLNLGQPTFLVDEVIVQYLSVTHPLQEPSAAFLPILVGAVGSI